MGIIYVSGADGKLRAPGNPIITPETPTMPGETLLHYDATLFGQSYARYKSATISGEGARYAAVENDTRYPVAGVTKRGGAVARVYADNLAGYATMCPSYIRDGQPMMLSFKPPQTWTASEFKTAFRNALDTKLTAFSGARANVKEWWCAWHEPDDDIYKDGSLNETVWVNWQVWGRQVLDEAAYSSRTDIRWGPIYTGSPFAKTTKAPRRWNDIYSLVTTAAGRPANEVWDYQGADRYNTAFDGPNKYMDIPNYMVWMDQMHAQTGLPMVIGETGSARPINKDFPGQTAAEQDVQRADWLRKLYDAMLAAGYFDAVAYWRVPALSGWTAAFSTIMITPSGYDATLAGNIPPGGFDAPDVVDVHSKYCIESMQNANPVIPYYVP